MDETLRCGPDSSGPASRSADPHPEPPFPFATDALKVSGVTVALSGRQTTEFRSEGDSRVVSAPIFLDIRGLVLSVVHPVECSTASVILFELVFITSRFVFSPFDPTACEGLSATSQNSLHESSAWCHSPLCVYTSLLCTLGSPTAP